MEQLRVNEFFENRRERLLLSAATGKMGLDRLILKRGVSRPGMALTGFTKTFNHSCIQVCGSAEIAYIRSATTEGARENIRIVLGMDIPCIIVSNDASIPRLLRTLAKNAGIPLFRSKLETSRLVYGLERFLNERFAPRTVLHGSLVDVHGVGLLLTGKSGIGKSEIALELLERGHRLVADDVVTVSMRDEGQLTGSGSELLKHYLELRGIGIVDIRSIFGLRAVRQEKRLEVEVCLEKWDSTQSYERLGMETSTTTHLGVEIPKMILPVFPGKSIAVIMEVIALNYILFESYGYRPADQLNERLINLMRKQTK